MPSHSESSKDDAAKSIPPEHSVLGASQAADREAVRPAIEHETKLRTISEIDSGPVR
jgi:hypothetical protein